MMTPRLLIIGLLGGLLVPTWAVGQDAHRRAESAWVSFSLNTTRVPGPVEVGALLPPGYDPTGVRVPLLLFLHGGGGTPQSLYTLRGTFEEMWEAGSFPKMVVVTPSARRSFYMDYRDGSQRWETFVLDDVISDARRRFSVEQNREGTLIAGASMGGMGALRMAFKHPNRFRAVAAWAPAVEPAFAFSEIDPSDRSHRSPALYEEIFGSPVDEEYWQVNHPPYILKTRLQEIIGSGMEIYIGVGREDQIHLYRAAEVMHRILYDAGVKHEFHVVRHADHDGTNLTAEWLRFLNHVMRPVK